jgi:pyridoxine 5-phosphate synthase
MSEIRLSVNINKVALVRNARGANYPDLLQVARDCERFGAQGITVHPRPDGRHVRQQDVLALRECVQTELNVEGYPSEDFLRMIESAKPDQVTLVPDPPEALTSSAGWDCIGQQALLQEVTHRIKEAGARVSIFLEPKAELVHAALETGTDRIELYTGPYAEAFAAIGQAPDAPRLRQQAIAAYGEAATLAASLGLGVNAGHDLNRSNLAYWSEQVPETLEVSIGHALWVDAWYLGMENTIRLYRRALGHSA